MIRKDYIILHHSASDNPIHDNLKTIREWHVARKFKMEGYHYYIRKDGAIEIGRPLHMVGAHCVGKNKNSIGVCLGGLHEFTEEQLHATARLIYNLKLVFKNLRIKGHRNFAKTACPHYSVGGIIERVKELDARDKNCLERYVI
jgi:N-acetyl-anhydromuramyl-L-alanine amidase AmpD